MSNPDVTS